MNPGDTVRFISKSGRWRFGRLVQAGRKWATVDVAGSKSKVGIDQLMAWPPIHEEKTTTRVKRGRN
jgi:hypothetical protein